MTLDLQEQREIMVLQAFQVHQECQDIQEERDKKEVQVNVVQKDHQVSEEEMVSLDPVESQDPQGPERGVKGVFLVLLALRVLLVHLGLKVLVVYMVNKALKASEVNLALPVLKVIEDFLVYLELKVIMVIEEKMDCQVLLVLQDDKGHLVRKELKDQKGLKDMMVKRDKEVSQAQLAYQESEDHLDHPVILGNQELKGFKDLQAYLAILVSLELKVRLVRLEE